MPLTSGIAFNVVQASQAPTAPIERQMHATNAMTPINTTISVRFTLHLQR
jgi:hypothetical protein